MPSHPRAHNGVSPTLRISCEAVPPLVSPAGAQGGTSARRTGAALSFVSCIRLLGRRALLLRAFNAGDTAAGMNKDVYLT